MTCAIISIYVYLVKLVCQALLFFIDYFITVNIFEKSSVSGTV